MPSSLEEAGCIQAFEQGLADAGGYYAPAERNIQIGVQSWKIDKWICRSVGQLIEHVDVGSRCEAEVAPESDVDEACEPESCSVGSSSGATTSRFSGSRSIRRARSFLRTRERFASSPSHCRLSSDSSIAFNTS